ncbi:hypothetical protein [Chelativorans sp. AA-79]|uniref:hypothetical protein n=1 Tax=Chelativorans sp. AA-79 TaxID=3028735 RepID=UPI0023F93BE2|nr:hypothetical protein [Chelativorans sp. AA-79]WEX07057.1 hypothetical protein PVE73_12960 [Chelativorans sp. AA-79]
MTRFSVTLLRELQMAVGQALEREGVLNVPAVAWEMKARFPEVSVAELEAEILAHGMALNAAMFFHGPFSHSGHPRSRRCEGSTLH